MTSSVLIVISGVGLGTSDVAKTPLKLNRVGQSQSGFTKFPVFPYLEPIFKGTLLEVLDFSGIGSKGEGFGAVCCTCGLGLGTTTTNFSPGLDEYLAL